MVNIISPYKILGNIVRKRGCWSDTKIKCKRNKISSSLEGKRVFMSVERSRISKKLEARKLERKKRNRKGQKTTDRKQVAQVQVSRNTTGEQVFLKAQVSREVEQTKKLAKDWALSTKFWIAQAAKRKQAKVVAKTMCHQWKSFPTTS